MLYAQMQLPFWCRQWGPNPSTLRKKSQQACPNVISSFNILVPSIASGTRASSDHRYASQTLTFFREDNGEFIGISADSGSSINCMDPRRSSLQQPIKATTGKGGSP